MLKVAAVTAWFVGLGFGIPCAIGMVHLARHGEIWTLMGFPTYGGGPFERMGLPTTVPLMALYLLVCIAEVALGVALWIGAPHATTYSYVLLPFEIAFWIGFALPFGPPFGIARVILVLLA